MRGDDEIMDKLLDAWELTADERRFVQGLSSYHRARAMADHQREELRARIEAKLVAMAAEWGFSVELEDVLRSRQT